MITYVYIRYIMIYLCIWSLKQPKKLPLGLIHKAHAVEAESLVAAAEAAGREELRKVSPGFFGINSLEGDIFGSDIFSDFFLKKVTFQLSELFFFVGFVI